MNGKKMVPGFVFLTFMIITMAACGGGGGTSGTSTGSATIQGSVPGTVVVAVDNATNIEVGRGTAIGTGTPKTFSMTLPTGASYRFYLMENEGTVNSRVYPMYMGTSNVFELDNNANGQTIDLGMVSPDLKTGMANPANTPALMMARGANPMVPPSLAGSAFSMDNVNGTMWNYTTMMTSGTMGWEHGTLAFNNNAGRMTGIVRNGSGMPDRNGIPFTMTMSGMLLNPGDNTFQGVASRDMSVMAATFTDSVGGPAMMIAQKQGGTFLPDGSDITGTWQFQRLTAGSDNTTSGWAFGTMQFSFGIGSTISLTTNTGLGNGRNFSFSMNGNGIMTDSQDGTFHGVMSADKSMIVAADTNGGNPELWVMMKNFGTTFSLTDMMGDWAMHAVSSGNTSSRGWTYGQSIIDANGNATFTGMMGSGGPVSQTQMTFQMNGGVMTMSGGGGMMGGGIVPSTFRGIMNGARNIMVSTYSDGSGGYPFSFQVK